MIRNMGLSSVWSIHRVAVQLVLQLVLAYFLLPSDFGQIALVLPVALFVMLIGELGLTAAIIRNAQLTPHQAGAAATVCFALGILIVAVAIALFAAGIYDRLDPPIGRLSVAFAGVVFLSLAALTPRAMLERRLRYGRLATYEIVASTVGLALAVLAGLSGAGVWSFAVFHLVMQAIRAVAFWRAASEDIAPTREWRAALPLIRVGGWILATSLIVFVMRYADNYVVGGFLGTTDLGLYAVASQVMLIPMMILTWPISTVLLATLSRLDRHPELRRQAFLDVLRLVALAAWMIVTLVVLLAPALVDLLLPARWNGVGPPIVRLAIAGGLQAVFFLSGPLFIIAGALRAQFILNVAMTLCLLGGIALAAHYGGDLVAVSDAYVFVTVLFGAANVYAICRFLAAPARALFHAALPAILVSVIGAAAVVGVRTVVAVPVDSVVGLAIALLAFGLAASLVLLVFRKAITESLATLSAAGRQSANEAAESSATDAAYRAAADTLS